MENREKMLHYSLAGILKPDQTLAIEPESGVTVLLSCADGCAHLVDVQILTEKERHAALPLLDHFPYYCPNEVLYAAILRGNTAETTVVRMRNLLNEAESLSQLDIQMRPVRNTVSRLRVKLRQFGIEISSILSTGYIVRKYKS